MSGSDFGSCGAYSGASTLAMNCGASASATLQAATRRDAIAVGTERSSCGSVLTGLRAWATLSQGVTAPAAHRMARRGGCMKKGAPHVVPALDYPIRHALSVRQGNYVPLGTSPVLCATR